MTDKRRDSLFRDGDVVYDLQWRSDGTLESEVDHLRKSYARFDEAGRPILIARGGSPFRQPYERGAEHVEDIIRDSDGEVCLRVVQDKTGGGCVVSELEGPQDALSKMAGQDCQDADLVEALKKAADQCRNAQADESESTEKGRPESETKETAKGKQKADGDSFAVEVEELEGGLDEVHFVRVLRAHRREARWCLDRKRGGEPASRVRLELAISAEGKTREASYEVSDDAVGRCLEEKTKRWVFPARDESSRGAAVLAW